MKSQAANTQQSAPTSISPHDVQAETAEEYFIDQIVNRGVSSDKKHPSDKVRERIYRARRY